MMPERPAACVVSQAARGSEATLGVAANGSPRRQAPRRARLSLNAGGCLAFVIPFCARQPRQHAQGEEQRRREHENR